jgi:hypothetical protein
MSKTLSFYDFIDARSDSKAAPYFMDPTFFAPVPGGAVRLTKLGEDAESVPGGYFYEIAMILPGGDSRYLTAGDGEWFSGFGTNGDRDAIAFICSKVKGLTPQGLTVA